MSLDNGILFYANNPRPIPLLAVALYSLRKIYDGKIHTVFGPEAPEWFISKLNPDITTYSILEEKLYNGPCHGLSGEWCQKAHTIVHKTPFDLTLYYDCDHTFLTPPDNEVWESIEANGLVTANDKPIVRRSLKIQRLVKKHIGIDLPQYRPVCGGCIGYKKYHTSGAKWLQLLDKFQKTDSQLNCLAEEWSLGTVLNLGDGSWIPGKWSVPHPVTEAFPDRPIDTCAIHYNGGRFLVAQSWFDEFLEAYAADWLDLKTNSHEYGRCWRSIRRLIYPRIPT